MDKGNRNPESHTKSLETPRGSGQVPRDFGFDRSIIMII